MRTHKCEIDGHRSCATPEDFAKAGSEPKNRRMERREASAPRLRGLRERSARGRKTPRKRLRAYVMGPRKGASQAPERLSALRSLFNERDEHANLGGLMTRENDDARAFARYARRSHPSP